MSADVEVDEPAGVFAQTFLLLPGGDAGSGGGGGRVFDAGEASLGRVAEAMLAGAAPGVGEGAGGVAVTLRCVEFYDDVACDLLSPSPGEARRRGGGEAPPVVACLDDLARPCLSRRGAPFHASQLTELLAEAWGGNATLACLACVGAGDAPPVKKAALDACAALGACRQFPVARRATHVGGLDAARRTMRAVLEAAARDARREAAKLRRARRGENAPGDSDDDEAYGHALRERLGALERALASSQETAATAREDSVKVYKVLELFKAKYTALADHKAKLAKDLIVAEQAKLEVARALVDAKLRASDVDEAKARDAFGSDGAREARDTSEGRRVLEEAKNVELSGELLSLVAQRDALRSRLDDLERLGRKSTEARVEAETASADYSSKNDELAKSLLETRFEVGELQGKYARAEAALEHARAGAERALLDRDGLCRNQPLATARHAETLRQRDAELAESRRLMDEGLAALRTMRDDEGRAATKARGETRAAERRCRDLELRLTLATTRGRRRGRGGRRAPRRPRGRLPRAARRRPRRRAAGRDARTALEADVAAFLGDDAASRAHYEALAASFRDKEAQLISDLEHSRAAEQRATLRLRRSVDACVALRDALRDHAPDAADAVGVGDLGALERGDLDDVDAAAAAAVAADRAQLLRRLEDARRRRAGSRRRRSASSSARSRRSARPLSLREDLAARRAAGDAAERARGGLGPARAARRDAVPRRRGRWRAEAAARATAKRGRDRAASDARLAAAREGDGAALAKIEALQRRLVDDLERARRAAARRPRRGTRRRRPRPRTGARRRSARARGGARARRRRPTIRRAATRTGGASRPRATTPRLHRDLEAAALARDRDEDAAAADLDNAAKLAVAEEAVGRLRRHLEALAAGPDAAAALLADSERRCASLAYKAARLEAELDAYRDYMKKTVRRYQRSLKIGPSPAKA
ncbi:hypothetical protein JL722_4140 [Aureococcus anophagefferens]|nr:hypothetical protein JL722_4140 [Aureococcus anophagefferens]